MYRPRRRAFADHDIHLAGFHDRVEHFFNGLVQTMDFINEQHVSRLQIGEYRSQVTDAFDGRTGSYLHLRIHFLGNDVRQGGLAQTGGAVKKHVFRGLSACLGRSDQYGKRAFDLLLSHIVGKCRRTQEGVAKLFFRGCT